METNRDAGSLRPTQAAAKAGGDYWNRFGGLSIGSRAASFYLALLLAEALASGGAVGIGL